MWGAIGKTGNESKEISGAAFTAALLFRCARQGTLTWRFESSMDPDDGNR
jgi:hypothetical protein